MILRKELYLAMKVKFVQKNYYFERDAKFICGGPVFI